MALHPMNADARLRLLLVEDNAGDADLAFEILADLESLKVDHVGGLVEATTAMRRVKYAAVLLDLNLPECRGIETARRFREIAGHTPIIVLSGVMDASIREAVLETGVADFLVKGESLPALLARSVLYTVHRRRAEAAHERLATLVSALPDAVIVTDANSVVRFVNPATEVLFGRPLGSFLGEQVHFASREGAVTEIEVLGASGSRMAELRVVDLEWDGEPARLAVLRDITEQRGIEDQLREASKLEAVGQLAGGVAHDFNNLLMVIMTYGGFVRDELAPDDPRRADILEVLRAAEAAAGLTKQLMIFSRRSGDEPRVVNAGLLVQGVHRFMGPALGAGIDVVVNIDPETWSIRVDDVLIEQVLINLAMNARDAMPHGGRLELWVANIIGWVAGCSGSEFVKITVSDTGHGMPESVAKRIFEPFFTTKEPGKGTGLGLAVSYGTIRQAGGQISVTSVEGQGTTFEIWIPRSKDEVPLRFRTPGPALRRMGSGTILLVEDERAVRASVVRVLRSEGYTVIELERGDDALAWIDAARSPPTLVLTDLVLPGVGGAQVAAAARQRWPDVPVVVVSGYAPDVERRKALGLADVQFVEKPFVPEALLALLHATLGQG